MALETTDLPPSPRSLIRNVPFIQNKKVYLGTVKAHLVFEKSEGLTSIQVPTADAAYTALRRKLRDGHRKGDVAAFKVAADELLRELSRFYRIRRPKLRLEGVRPHKLWEGTLAEQLDGLYEGDTITVWTRTAIHRRLVAFRTLMYTLVHEYCHHLDYEYLELPRSFHTKGFFDRQHLLYRRIMRESWPGDWARAGNGGWCWRF